MEKRNRRGQLFVDPKFQGALLLRVATYWFLGMFVMGLLIGFQVFFGDSTAPIKVNLSRVLLHFEPALTAALLILPVMLLDCLRVTSKFAGPIVRLRGELHNLASGAPVRQVTFRDNDLCEGLATDFNKVVERIQGPLAHSFNHEIARREDEVEREEPVGAV